MREIKFRGLTSHSKEWRYGNLAKINDSYHIFEQCDLTEDGHHIRQDSDRPTWIEEETIGQFTGLYDKNGKEIYEGDVIGDNSIYYIIIYNQLETKFTAKYINNGKLITENCTLNQAWFNESNKIIVGNIYDNPEFDEK